MSPFLTRIPKQASSGTAPPCPCFFCHSHLFTRNSCVPGTVCVLVRAVSEFQRPGHLAHGGAWGTLYPVCAHVRVLRKSVYRGFGPGLFWVVLQVYEETVHTCGGQGYVCTVGACVPVLLLQALQRVTLAVQRLGCPGAAGLRASGCPRACCSGCPHYAL